MRDYKILSQDEQDDIIVSFLLAQERDLFCHQANLDRYNQMLDTLPEGKWKTQVTRLGNETAERLVEVISIIAATEHQLPSAERIEAARARLKGMRDINGVDS